jgi:hypothetical protein
MQNVPADDTITAAQKAQRIFTGAVAAVIACCVMAIAGSLDFIGLIGLISVGGAIFLCILVGFSSKLEVDARIFIGLAVITLGVLAPSGLSVFSSPSHPVDPIPMIQYVPTPAAEVTVIPIVSHP